MKICFILSGLILYTPNATTEAIAINPGQDTFESTFSMILLAIVC